MDELEEIRGESVAELEVKLKPKKVKPKAKLSKSEIESRYHAFLKKTKEG